MIPLSSGIDKYKRIMEKKEKAGKPCDILHIVKLDDSRESAFLIKVMGMLKRGIKFTPTQPDVMAIMKKLKGRSQ